MFSPADDTPIFEVLTQAQQEIVTVVLSYLTHPLRSQDRQHQFKLAGNIVRLSTKRESGPYRLFRALYLRPLAVAQLPQPDRSGIAQQLTDFFQPA